VKRLVVVSVAALALAGCPKRAKPKNATHVWLGPRHACATWTTGETACWGANEKGQLGVNDHVDSLVPLALPPMPAPSAMTLGDDWTCVTDRCWGSRTTPPKDPEEGKGHHCKLFEDRSVHCWGDNDSGQLGDGTTTKSTTPTIVTGLGDAAEVHTGSHHSCARLLNGTVSCWGKNDRSQLANGTKDASSKPVAIFGLTGIKELAVAGDSACALLSDGEIRCWGANDFGQLGDGTKTEHNVPGAVRSPR